MILGTVWKRFGIEASAQHLARAQEIDPLNEVADKLLGTRSPFQVVDPTMADYVPSAEEKNKTVGNTPVIIDSEAVRAIDDDEAGPMESLVEEAESIIAQYIDAEKSAAESPRELVPVKDIDHLTLAREHRDANLWHQALAEYDWVVQHSLSQVDEVIRDLEILAQRADMPVRTHHILGDAYARADRLAQALYHYRFVLEHIAES